MKLLRVHWLWVMMALVPGFPIIHVPGSDVRLRSQPWVCPLRSGPVMRVVRWDVGDHGKGGIQVGMGTAQPSLWQPPCQVWKNTGGVSRAAAELLC